MKDKIWLFIHNLVAHPMLAIAMLFPPLRRFAEWLHDNTLP